MPFGREPLLKSALVAVGLLVAGLSLSASPAAAMPLGYAPGIADTGPVAEPVYYHGRRFYGRRFYGPRRYYARRFYGPHRFYRGYY